MSALRIPAAEIQGNVLRGYRSQLRLVRYLFLEVADARAARAFLSTAAAGGNAEVPEITSDATWEGKKLSCFNVGFTYSGLKALGVPQSSLDTFPREFVQGMAARSLKLGDFGASAAENWPAPFDQPDRIHVIAGVYACDDEECDGKAALDRIEAQVARAFTVLGRRDGAGFAGDRVHFNFRDSISQPRFRDRPGQVEPTDPLGTVLLGWPTRQEGLFFGVPEPKADLGFNGTFGAFRVLWQDCAGFEAYLDTAAAELEQRLPGDSLKAIMAPEDAPKIVHQLLGEAATGASPEEMRRLALREIVAAQMLGRWRDGAPYGSCPDVPDPEAHLTEYDYPSGTRCPAGAHVRRCNPRGGAMVQRISAFTRRIVRRGVPYGKPWNPLAPDEEERGLLGYFIGASLGAQFEAIMSDWLNLGLHHPEITRSNDPLLGANEPETSWFDLMLKDGTPLRLRGFPRFVVTRGGAYTFIPSMRAIAWIGALKG